MIKTNQNQSHSPTPNLPLHPLTPTVPNKDIIHKKQLFQLHYPRHDYLTNKVDVSFYIPDVFCHLLTICFIKMV